MPTGDGLRGVWDPELDSLPTQGGSPAKKAASRELELDGYRASNERGFAAGARLREASESFGFSIAAGAAGPLLCLVLDPLVFKGGDEHGPIFGQVWVFGYSFIAVEILVLLLWLVVRERLGAFSAVVAGTLLVGTVFAGGLGLALLPLSVAGLMALIGALGFTPFLTASVYFYNGLLALRSARSRVRPGFMAPLFALGVVLAIALPYSIQSGVQRGWRAAIRRLADGDVAAVKRAQFFGRFVYDGGEDDPLELAIRDEHDPIKKQRLIEYRGVIE